MESELKTGAITVEQAAKLLDLTPRRIQQLVKDGIVQRDSRGQYDLVALVRGYVGYLREQLGRGPDQNEERARLLSAKAELAEMEAAEKAGRLVDAEEMERAIFSAVRDIRQAFAALPDRVAAELAAESDEIAIVTRLRAEIGEVLSALRRIEAEKLEAVEAESNQENGG